VCKKFSKKISKKKITKNFLDTILQLWSTGESIDRRWIPFNNDHGESLVSEYR